MSLLEGFKEPVIFDVQVIAEQAMAQFKAINGELDKMGASGAVGASGINKMEAAGKVASGVLLGLGAAAGVFAVMSVRAAMDAETAITRMNVAMKNTGNASQADLEAAKALTQQNVRLGFSVEDTAIAFGSLITATGSQKDATQLLSVAEDMARYKHISLNEAATALARGTQGNARAFKEYGISLDTTIPKQDAINKAMDELRAKVSGQSAAYLDTFAGKMSKMGAEAKLAEEKFGNFLIPILTKGIDVITHYGKEIIIFVGVLASVAAGIKIVEGVTKAWNAAVVIQEALQTALYTKAMVSAGAVTVFGAAEAAAATEVGLATKAMILFDLAMDANPIMVVVTAVGLLAAAFIGLDKLLGDGKGQGYTGQAQDTGRSSLAGIQAKRAQDALDAKAKALGISQDKYNPHGQTNSMTTQDSFDLTGVLAEQQAKARLAAQKKSHTAAVSAEKKHAADLKTANKEVATIYSQMNKVIDDAGKKQADLQVQEHDRDVAAQQNYNDTKLNLERTYAQDMFKLKRSNTDAIAKLNRSAQEADAKAQQTYDDAIKAEATKNADAITAINKTYTDKVTADTLAATNKQQAIVDKSIAMLTNAWQTGTGFTLSDINKGKDLSALSGDTADSMASALQTQLNKVTQLQKDAGALAAKGFSQTFIEQIVTQGPDAGDAMAKTVLNATPEVSAKIKDLYGKVNDVSMNGMDSLAKSMNSGASLATKQLTDEYAQVAVDLKVTLATTASDLTAALAAQQVNFSAANAAAKKTLTDSQIATAQSLANGLADQKQSYDNSVFDMNTTLDNGLNDAQKVLDDAIKASHDQFSKDIASLHDSTMANLESLETKLKAVADRIKALSGITASVKIMANSPAAGIIADTNNIYGDQSTPQIGRKGENGNQAPIIGNLNVTVQQPQDAPQTVIDAIKYGALASARQTE